MIFKEITEKFPELIKDMEFSNNNKLIRGTLFETTERRRQKDPKHVQVGKTEH